MISKSSQIITTKINNIEFFYRGDALPVALKGKISHSMDLLTKNS